MLNLESIEDKVERGIRISEADALFLFHSPDMLRIGAMADKANRRINEGKAFYNINSHLNPTNVCVYDCKFCSFARKPTEEGSFAYSIDEILQRAHNAVANGARELHMVGGLHPRWRFEYYLDMIRKVKQTFPDVHIKAFTAVEIDWLAKKARLSIEEVFDRLMEAGLGSMPGGGAEIFHDAIREQITAKLSTEKWIDIHRIAHRKGLKTNCTMLYGHIEDYSHRVYHIAQLRALQDETGGFNCFIPLSFQPVNNEMGIKRYTFGFDDLKVIAVARIFLDNFRNIKSYWVMTGQDTAQLALNFGANDLDGTVQDEKISLMAGGRSGRGLIENQLTHLIWKSGHMPVERDTLYNPIHVHPTPVPSVDPKKMKKPEPYAVLLDEPDLFKLAAKAQAVQQTFGGGSVRTFAAAQYAISGLAKAGAGDFKDANAWANAASVTVFDLALNPNFTLPELYALIESVRGRSKAHPFCIHGIKQLWQMAQAAKEPLETVLTHFKDCGIASIGSSPNEAETDLTASELNLLHGRAHRLDIATTAKVELVAPPTPGTPLWSSFVARLSSLRDLQNETRGLLGVAIEPGADSFITAVEYMRALAIARVILDNIPHIMAPIEKIPTVVPRLLAPFGLHGQEKIAAMALLMGADDLGTIDLARIDLAEVLATIGSAGLVGTLRTDRFDAVSLPAMSPVIGHVPGGVYAVNGNIL